MFIVPCAVLVNPSTVLATGNTADAEPIVPGNVSRKPSEGNLQHHTY